jgi:hypothetical protein
MSSPAVRPSSSTAAVTTPDNRPAGRLAVLSAAAIAVNAIPIPFVPDRLVGRVRGALAHDVATRHGLSLTPEARARLAGADPSSDEGGRAAARKVAEVISRTLLKRAFSPFGTFTTIARAVEVYALGHLFDRYLARVRKHHAVRVDEAEARKVREAIDRSLLRAFAPGLHLEALTVNEPVEDLRDQMTRWIDNVILTGATLPGYIERRLEAAFDEIVAATGGIGDG